MALWQCFEQIPPNFTVDFRQQWLREGLPWHCYSAVSSFNSSAQKERGCHDNVTVLWAVSSQFYYFDFRQQQQLGKRGVAVTLSQYCEQFHPSFAILISGSNSGSKREGLPWHCHSAVSSSTPVLPFWFQAAIVVPKERGCHDIVTVLWAVPPQFYHFDFRQQ